MAQEFNKRYAEVMPNIFQCITGEFVKWTQEGWKEMSLAEVRQTFGRLGFF